MTNSLLFNNNGDNKYNNIKFKLAIRHRRLQLAHPLALLGRLAPLPEHLLVMVLLEVLHLLVVLVVVLVLVQGAVE